MSTEKTETSDYTQKYGAKLLLCYYRGYQVITGETVYKTHMDVMLKLDASACVSLTPARAHIQFHKHGVVGNEKDL